MEEFVTTSCLTFDTFLDYHDHKMARMETKEYEIPVNIYAEEGTDFNIPQGASCNIEVYGEVIDCRIYADEKERLNDDDNLAPIAMIPMGTFSATDDPDFIENPQIYFSGKVLAVNTLQDSEDFDYAVLLETLDLTIILLMEYDGKITEGNYIIGMAWLYADITADS